MNLDYIAGFFDGDGWTCICFHRQKATRYGFSVRIQAGITQSRNQPRNMAKEIRDYLGFGLYREHGFFRTVEFNKRGDVQRLIELIKPKTILKQSALGLLEDALKIVPYHQHYTRGTLLSLLGIREKLSKQVLPSRSGYARRLNRIDELRQQILRITEPFLHEEDTSFPVHLRRARKLRGWTQQKLGEQVGISKVMIWKYENGKCLPSRTRYTRLTQELNLPELKIG